MWGRFSECSAPCEVDNMKSFALEGGSDANVPTLDDLKAQMSDLYKPDGQGETVSKFDNRGDCGKVGCLEGGSDANVPTLDDLKAQMSDLYKSDDQEKAVSKFDNCGDCGKAGCLSDGVAPKDGQSRQEIVDGRTRYYDDNGQLYRDGTDLVPNAEYEINGYKYQTDEQGRITSAEGTLHIKDREGRLPIRDTIEDIGKGYQLENDDRGHLIGDQFDGSNGLENMIPQNADINRNEFRHFENDLARSVKEGKEVQVSIEPVYDGISRRPEAIVFTYSIDGMENLRVFPNAQEGL